MSWVVGAAIFAVMAVGCGKAKEGDSCNNPQCEDTHTAFFCEDGVYRSIPCPGSNGCKANSSDSEVLIECDVSTVTAGMQCPADYKGFVLCKSGNSALVCGGIVWDAQTCTSPCANSDPNNQGGVCQ
jgi:hypothetical protein